MADNIAVTPGTGATVATDEVPPGGGIHYQRVKLGMGPDGVATDLAPATAAVQSAFSGAGAIPTANIGCWAKQHTPAVSIQATTFQPASATGARHVCTAVCFGWSASTAVAATTVTVKLIDGVSGGALVLWAWQFALTAATALPVIIPVTDLAIVGSINTAMTLEFSALLVNLMQFVNMTGYDVS